ncbi:unnamed protein product, partial [Auanema sp. JU1783]
NKIRYISFSARALTKSERNYSTTKRELLAIVYIFTKYHQWLYGNPFTLYTDHKALVYLNTQDIPNPMMLNWFETIFNYTFSVVHRPGIDNVLPDALSRLFSDEDNKLEGGKTEKILSNSSHTSATQTNSDTTDGNTNRIAAVKAVDYMTPPPEERHSLLLNAHLLGHYGADHIVTTLHNDNLHWTNMKQEALSLVGNCPDCQLYNVGKHGYHPPRSILADAPGDHWAMDLGSFNVTSSNGNNYILVMVDMFTRFTILRALPDKSGATIAK